MPWHSAVAEEAQKTAGQIKALNRQMNKASSAAERQELRWLVKTEKDNWWRCTMQCFASRNAEMEREHRARMADAEAFFRMNGRMRKVEDR